MSLKKDLDAGTESKFMINASDFKSVHFLHSIIDQKTPYNAIKNIQITSKNNNLKLSATNLEIFMIKEIEGNYQIPEIKVKSNVFCECIKKLSGEINLEIEGNKIKLEDSKGKFVLVNSEEKFPEENIEQMEYVGKIENKRFIDGIKSVGINVNAQEKGVCKLIVKGNKLEIVVYDKKRICFSELEMQESVTDLEAMISPKYIKEIKKLSGEIKIYKKNNKIMLESEGGKMVIKTIEGNNIDHKKFIKELGDSCEVKLSDLKDGVQRALITSSELIRNLLLRFSSQAVEIISYDPTVGLTEVSFEKKGLLESEASFNGDDLLDVISCCPSEQITISQAKNDRDTIITSGETRYVLAKLVLKSLIPEIKVSGIEVKIDCAKIQEHVESLDDIIDQKTPYNAIKNIQITSKNNNLKLSATNLEIFMIKEIEGNYQIPEIKVKSNVFCECIKKLSGEINLEIEGNKIKLEDSKGKFVLVNSEEKFPEENIEQMEYVGKIENKRFIDGIKSVGINVNAQEKGVCKLIVKGNKLEIVVYDKKRICFSELEMQESVTDLEAMISPKYIKEIKKLSGEIKIYKKNNKIMLESEGGKMVIKTIEGNNIDHKKFIKELGDSCEVKLSDLKDGVQKCLINTQTNSVSKLRLQCGESSINISYFDYLEDTLATQTIDCKNFIKFTNQEDGVFFLNGVFLLDILKNMHQETVSLFFKPTGREVILKNFAWYVSIKLIQIK